MTVQDVIDSFRDGKEKRLEDEEFAKNLFQDAIRITMELNNKYHTPEEIREIMAELTGKRIDDTFRLFPPFYTDFGKNITIGKNVFFNSGCHFQDQGGIEIGDGCLIGHNVVLATINHDLYNLYSEIAKTYYEISQEDYISRLVEEKQEAIEAEQKKDGKRNRL